MNYDQNHEYNDSNRSFLQTYGQTFEQPSPGNSSLDIIMVIPRSDHCMSLQPDLFGLPDESGSVMAHDSWLRSSFQDPALNSSPTVGPYSSFNPPLRPEPSLENDKRWDHFETQQFPVECSSSHEQASGSHFDHAASAAMGFPAFEADTDHFSRITSQMTGLDHTTQHLSEFYSYTFPMTRSMDSGSQRCEVTPALPSLNDLGEQHQGNPALEVHFPWCGGELFSCRKTVHCLVSAFKQEHHELLKVILMRLGIDLETDQKWQILSAKCSRDSAEMEEMIEGKRDRKIVSNFLNHCVDIIYQRHMMLSPRNPCNYFLERDRHNGVGVVWRGCHGTIDESYRRVQAIVNRIHGESAFLGDPVLDLPDPNTFVSSVMYNEARDASLAYTGRTHDAYLPDGQVSQSWTGPFNPSLVIDGIQVEPAILDPHIEFPPTVTLDNEPLSDEASEDDVCGGSLFECTRRNGQSRSSMEREDIALLELLIRFWGLKDPRAIMEPAFMSGATRLTDYQYDGWLSRFVTWCRYEIGVIHGHTQCPSLQKTLEAHHTASGNACRRPSRKSGPSLKFARDHVCAIPPKAWKAGIDPDLRRQLLQQLGLPTTQS
jgi:hypothetical protein